MKTSVTAAYPIKRFGDIQIDNSIFCAGGRYSVRSARNIKYIVIHYTGNAQDSALSNAKYYAGKNAREASAHYFVDERECYQSVALHNIAWAVGAKSYRHNDCRNANSVSIEMCTSGKYSVADRTIENTAMLCAELCRYLNITDIDTFVLRHYDVTGKACPAAWARDDAPGWEAFKRRIKEILTAADEPNFSNLSASPVSKRPESASEVQGDWSALTKGDIDMEELKALKEAVENLSKQVEELKGAMPKVYRYTQDIPDWGRRAVQELLDEGIFAGAAPDDLNLSEDLLRMLVIEHRRQVAANGE